ncbi:oxygen-insensitive NADPH nitroreductase [Companilactobacillus nantensis]|uniref:Nitroreductase (Oxidoreductase) n=1 Tax=Companilactobacillus nantensis DSM 16982 TaxID=1423774 RepID=A0A0R1WC07_9LACO|nr:oxygen-insensitive NADPH nitroreductase [Companilactobacillus nantensis]KRM15378.1 nitroreductase (oxidoreductase) [Companilactobacillus nantensis DSM 16982]GEO65039.1 NADPH-dependent oxidoreductase [Companilactobacillus nantensis]
MNPTIENMLKHVSVRKFTDQPVTADQKNSLIAAAQHGSTTEFVQAFSIIEITDQKLRNKLSDITISSPHVKKADTFYVFVADLHRQATILRANNEKLDSIKNMEALLLSTIDTTIAAENMAVAAESMGLGICYIGSLRNNIKQVAELLHLPDFTVPLFGMTIGVPLTKNQLKPRMPQRNQVATNSYDATEFNELSNYDQIVKDYYINRQTNPSDTSWTEKNLAIFKEVHRADVGAFLKSQGFSLS